MDTQDVAQSVFDVWKQYTDKQFNTSTSSKKRKRIVNQLFAENQVLTESSNSTAEHMQDICSTILKKRKRMSKQEAQTGPEKFFIISPTAHMDAQEAMVFSKNHKHVSWSHQARLFTQAVKKLALPAAVATKDWVNIQKVDEYTENLQKVKRTLFPKQTEPVSTNTSIDDELDEQKIMQQSKRARQTLASVLPFVNPPATEVENELIEQDLMYFIFYALSWGCVPFITIQFDADRDDTKPPTTPDRQEEDQDGTDTSDEEEEKQEDTEQETGKQPQPYTRIAKLNEVFAVFDKGVITCYDIEKSSKKKLVPLRMYELLTQTVVQQSTQHFLSVGPSGEDSNNKPQLKFGGPIASAYASQLKYSNLEEMKIAVGNKNITPVMIVDEDDPKPADTGKKRKADGSGCYEDDMDEPKKKKTKLTKFEKQKIEQSLYGYANGEEQAKATAALFLQSCEGCDEEDSEDERLTSDLTKKTQKMQTEVDKIIEKVKRGSQSRREYGSASATADPYGSIITDLQHEEEMARISKTNDNPVRKALGREIDIRSEAVKEDKRKFDAYKRDVSNMLKTVQDTSVSAMPTAPVFLYGVDGDYKGNSNQLVDPDPNVRYGRISAHPSNAHTVALKEYIERQQEIKRLQRMLQLHSQLDYKLRQQHLSDINRLQLQQEDSKVIEVINEYVQKPLTDYTEAELYEIFLQMLQFDNGRVREQATQAATTLAKRKAQLASLDEQIKQVTSTVSWGGIDVNNYNKVMAKIAEVEAVIESSKFETLNDKFKDQIGELVKKHALGGLLQIKNHIAECVMKITRAESKQQKTMEEIEAERDAKVEAALQDIRNTNEQLYKTLQDELPDGDNLVTGVDAEFALLDPPSLDDSTSDSNNTSSSCDDDDASRCADNSDCDHHHMDEEDCFNATGPTWPGSGGSGRYCSDDDGGGGGHGGRGSGSGRKKNKKHRRKKKSKKSICDTRGSAMSKGLQRLRKDIHVKLNKTHKQTKRQMTKFYKQKNKSTIEMLRKTMAASNAQMTKTNLEKMTTECEMVKKTFATVNSLVDKYTEESVTRAQKEIQHKYQVEALKENNKQIKAVYARKDALNQSHIDGLIKQCDAMNKALNDMRASVAKSMEAAQAEYDKFTTSKTFSTAKDFLEYATFKTIYSKLVQDRVRSGGFSEKKVTTSQNLTPRVQYVDYSALDAIERELDVLKNCTDTDPDRERSVKVTTGVGTQADIASAKELGAQEMQQQTEDWLAEQENRHDETNKKLLEAKQKFQEQLTEALKEHERSAKLKTYANLEQKLQARGDVVRALLGKARKHIQTQDKENSEAFESFLAQFKNLIETHNQDRLQMAASADKREALARVGSVMQAESQAKPDLTTAGFCWQGSSGLNGCKRHQEETTTVNPVTGDMVRETYDVKTNFCNIQPVVIRTPPGTKYRMAMLNGTIPMWRTLEMQTELDSVHAHLKDNWLEDNGAFARFAKPYAMHVLGIDRLMNVHDGWLGPCFVAVKRVFPDIVYDDFVQVFSTTYPILFVRDDEDDSGGGDQDSARTEMYRRLHIKNQDKND